MSFTRSCSTRAVWPVYWWPSPLTAFGNLPTNTPKGFFGTWLTIVTLQSFSGLHRKRVKSPARGDPVMREIKFCVLTSRWPDASLHNTVNKAWQTPRGGAVLIIFLGGGVPPGPENPYPISDQKIQFSIPYFRPDSQNVYPISDPVMCDNFGNSQ